MRRFSLILMLVLVAILLPASVFATPVQQGGEAIDLTVVAGFDGYYHTGEWIPLRVEASNTGPEVAGSLVVRQNNLGGGDVLFTYPIELATGSRKEVFLYFSPEGFLSNVTVDLMNGNQTLATVQTRVNQLSDNDNLYAVISDNPSEFGELGLVKPANGSAQVAIVDVADLPPIAEAWQSLDVLVFSDVDTGTLSSEQREALRAWLTSGGRLMVTGGASWQRTAAGLDEFLPVSVTGTQTLSNLGSLPQLTGSAATALGVDTVVAITDPRADAEVVHTQDSLALWVGQDVGLGRVDYLAFDPALEPLRSWGEIEDLWWTVLSQQPVAPGWSAGFTGNWYLAREAVVAIPGVSLPSALQLCGFLTLYAVIIGPLNYFVLKRMRRTEMAWVSIPAIVLLFSACAYITGFQLRGTRAITHRLTMVQSWHDSDVAQVDSLVGLWSPRRAGYDVEIGQNFLARPMPEDGFGVAFGAITDRVFEEGDTRVMRDVRVDVGAVQTFVVNGHAPATHVESSLAMTLEGGVLRIQGDIVNTSGSDFDNVAVLVAGAIQNFDQTLAQGESLRVDMSMLSGRASPASFGAFAQAPGLNAVNAAGSAGPLPYYYNDTTVEEILGVSNCYRASEVQRRCNMLRVAIDGSAQSTARGGRVYMVGWTDQSPLDISVLGPGSNDVETAVYFFELPVNINQSSAEGIIVPPSLMTWLTLEGDNASPYDLYLQPQTLAVFRYAPLDVLTLGDVTGLVLHFDPQYVNEPLPNFEIWNWTRGEWEELDVDWGDTRIAQPQNYVDEDGQVQVRLSTGNYASVSSIERIDVTLEGTGG